MTAKGRSRFHFLPPVLNAAVVIGHTLLMYRAALKHTGGNISYPVDDTFIHLALAKHLALDGTYGIAANQFAATSSSVGWPILLSLAIKIAGPNVALPLYLTGAFAVMLAFVVDRAARLLVPGIGGVARFLVGLSVMAFTPMPTVIVLGMEHAPHIVAHILFVSTVSRWLAARPEEGEKAPSLYCCAALAFFVTFWRYEGAFPVGLAALLAVLRGRFKGAAALLGAGALPGVAFGIYAKAHGSLFLPIPVVLKGRHVEVSRVLKIFVGDLMDRFGQEAGILAVVLCVVIGAIVTRRRTFWQPLTVAGTLTAGVTILHLQLASLGWFYRYEAYLLAGGLAFGTMAVAHFVEESGGVIALAKRQPMRFALGLSALALLAMPLQKRAVQANDDTPTACANIYNQQGQSARFLAGFDTPVAINDIGAVAWFGDEPIIDLVGLASLPVAKAKDLQLEQQIPVPDIARFTAQTRVAIVYDEWFKNGFPSSWLRVGRWRIPNNKSCAFPVVSIYATDPATYPEVIEALRRFSPKMPHDVDQYGRYVEHPSELDRLAAGDQIVIRSDVRELAGGYTIEEDGAILLPGIRSERATLAGSRIDDAGPKLATRILEIPPPAPGEVNVHGAKILGITRAVHSGRVQVAGAVPHSVVVPVTTIADAVTASGGSAGDAARVWAWRETSNGFVRIEHDALGESVVDGDILVVPALK